MGLSFAMNLHCLSVFHFPQMKELEVLNDSFQVEHSISLVYFGQPRIIQTLHL